MSSKCPPEAPPLASGMGLLVRPRMTNARNTFSLVLSALVFVIGLTFADSANADNELSYELRLQSGSAQRWSNDFGFSYDENVNEKSFYFTTGLGFRMFTPRGHGWLADADYRFGIHHDPDPGENTYPIVRFVVGHVGYAYRHIIHSRKEPERRVWALTPTLSFSVGSAQNKHPRLEIPESSPVFGFRAAFDVDYHVNRFLLGWTLSYEYLRHTGTGNALESSHFLGWNVIPIMRMGVTFGEKVQKL